jgi:hypothetical protein
MVKKFENIEFFSIKFIGEFGSTLGIIDKPSMISI